MAKGQAIARLVRPPNHTVIVSGPTSSQGATLACLSYFELTCYFACMMFVQMRRHFPEAGNTRRHTNET